MKTSILLWNLINSECIYLFDAFRSHYAERSRFEVNLTASEGPVSI